MYIKPLMLVSTILSQSSKALDDWERMVDTNIKGLMYMTRAFLPGMVERGRGHVFNLGSIAGRYVGEKK